MPQDETAALSDHCPIVADFDLVLEQVARDWTIETFADEIGARHGAVAGEVVRTIADWAQRKQRELDDQGIRDRILTRFPISANADPEWWLQIDLKDPPGLQYTFSVKADGRVVVQFQHMKQPPFDDEVERHRLLKEFNAIPGVALEEYRVGGRPAFSLSVLEEPEHLRRFLSSVETIVRRTRERSAVSTPADPKVEPRLQERAGGEG